MVRQKSLVTCVEANGAFIYVWLQDNMEGVESLHANISSAVATLQPETEPIRPGATLIAQAADHQFYRVRVVRPSFEFEGHYRCFFLDCGSFETLSVEKLFKLPSKLSLQSIPQQARCSMLDGIVAKSSDSWPDNVMASLSQRLLEREFLVEELGICGPYSVVQLFELKSGINVVDILANAGLGRRESAYGRWTQYIPPNPKLQSGSNLVVKITEVESVTDFQVTVEPNVVGVDLKTIMVAAAKLPKLPFLPPILPHTLCLARVDSPGDGICFYRAEVVSAEPPPSNNVHIRLMDLGKKVCLPSINLHTMPPELLRLPPLSLHMCLAGLELSADDHPPPSQLEWLRGLCFRPERVAVTILHTLSPNFYAVVFNEMGIINLSPLPYRLLPMLGQRPFDLFLKRSLAPCSFNEPVLPAVLSSSLPSYDVLMAAFSSYLSWNSLTKLPPSAGRAGVFCIAFDESNESAPYPLRCVILTPIMGSQMQLMLYEIDTGRQSVRLLDHVYCAPAWSFAHPSFCVPVVAFDAHGKPAAIRAASIQVRAIHREPVASPAGIIVVQETLITPITYENPRSLPVIEEVIIDDWDADTASETASSVPEDAPLATVDQVIPQEAVTVTVQENVPAENGKHEEEEEEPSTDLDKSPTTVEQGETVTIEMEISDHHVPSDEFCVENVDFGANDQKHADVGENEAQTLRCDQEIGDRTPEVPREETHEEMSVDESQGGEEGHEGHEENQPPTEEVPNQDVIEAEPAQPEPSPNASEGVEMAEEPPMVAVETDQKMPEEENKLAEEVTEESNPQDRPETEVTQSEQMDQSEEIAQPETSEQHFDDVKDVPQEATIEPGQSEPEVMEETSDQVVQPETEEQQLLEVPEETKPEVAEQTFDQAIQAETEEQQQLEVPQETVAETEPEVMEQTSGETVETEEQQQFDANNEPISYEVSDNLVTENVPESTEIDIKIGKDEVVGEEDRQVVEMPSQDEERPCEVEDQNDVAIPESAEVAVCEVSKEEGPSEVENNGEFATEPTEPTENNKAEFETETTEEQQVPEAAVEDEVTFEETEPTEVIETTVGENGVCEEQGPCEVAEPAESAEDAKVEFETEMAEEQQVEDEKLPEIQENQENVPTVESEVEVEEGKIDMDQAGSEVVEITGLENGVFEEGPSEPEVNGEFATSEPTEVKVEETEEQQVPEAIAEEQRFEEAEENQDKFEGEIDRGHVEMEKEANEEAVDEGIDENVVADDQQEEDEFREEQPVVAVVVEAPCDDNNLEESNEMSDTSDGGATEMTEVGDLDDQALADSSGSSNTLTIEDRSCFEKQHSVPARALSENAIANQALSPSCPFTILITPASRSNSMDPNAAEETKPPTQEVQKEIANEVVILVEEPKIGNFSSDRSNTPPLSLVSENGALPEIAVYNFPNPLPYEGAVPITISHVPENVAWSKQFWIRHDDDYQSVKSRYISNYLNNHGSRLPLVEEETPADILPGFCCIAPCELSGKFFRVEVVEFLNADNSTAKVRYVDHGRTDVCRVCRFRLCPQELMTVPRLAYLCFAPETSPDDLSGLTVDTKRQLKVVSYCEETHIHHVSIDIPTICSLQPRSVTERIGVEGPYEIAYVEGPNQFYVKIVDDENEAKQYDQMNRHLQDYAVTRNPHSRLQDWTDCLLVVLSDDGLWKRAVALASQTDSFRQQNEGILVQLIDSGKTEAVSFELVRPFSFQRPFDLPPQVARVQLSNVDEMLTPVTASSVGEIVTLKVLETQSEPCHLMQLNVKCCDPKLLEKPVVSPVAPSQPRSLPRYLLDFTGSTQKVQITHFESLHDDLFVQLESDVPVVEEINELLNLLNENPDGGNTLRLIEKPEVGMICASRFPEDVTESMLYRCEVISLDPLTVFYVDYGNTEEVTRLLEMPADEQQFWGPPLVHRCRLLQTAESLTKHPERVEETLQEPDACLNLRFIEAFSNEKPIVYSCEVVLPPEAPEVSLPDYPSLTDGIYSPTHLTEDIIWLQSEELGLGLIQLESDLQTLCEDHTLVPLTNYIVGKGCIVSSSGDCYRGEITHVEPTSVSVLRIDYGQEGTFPASDIQTNRVTLYSIQNPKIRRILDIPRLALPCRLLDDTDAYRRLRLSDFPHISYMVTFAQTISGSAAPFLVDLRALDDRSSTTTPGYRGPLSAARPATFMFPSPVAEPQTKTTGGMVAASSNAVESGYGGDSVFDGPDSPFESPASKSVSNIFKPAFSDGSRFRAICVYVSCEVTSGTENNDVAFFHDESRSAELDKLYDALSDISRLSPINFPDISVGSMVAARYSVDGLWYRAIVLSKPLNRDAGLTVFFIDYGNCEKIPSCTQADIRQLPPSLSPDRIKPLAIAIRPFFNPHAPSMPVRFQCDETYILEVISSNSYLTGMFSTASRIPVLVVNVVSDATPQPPPLLQQQQQPKPPVQPKLEAVSVQNVMAAVAKQIQPVRPVKKAEVKLEPVAASGSIRYSSAELRKLRQTAPTSISNLLANLENIIGILRISEPPAATEHFQHDSRLRLPTAPPVNVVAVSGAIHFSVRPFPTAQLPEAFYIKPFAAKVVWTTEDLLFIQPETVEMIAKLDLADSLAQSCGSSSSKVGEKESPMSLFNKALLAKWTAGDGRWYRAVVRNVANPAAKPPKVEVYFVDFGNSDVVPITDLVLLSDTAVPNSSQQRELLRMPVMAIPIFKGSFKVRNDDSVKICLERQPQSVPPYKPKSLEIIQ